MSVRWRHSQVTGLVHGSSSAEAIACLDRLRQELLVYGRDAAVVFDAVRLDPGFAAAHALAAAMHILVMSSEGMARARPMAQQALGLARLAPARERLLVQAIACWADGDAGGAERHLERLVSRWPTDLVAARLLQVHQLNRGDFPAMARTTGALLVANPCVSHVRGMHAFALAETGDLRAAERFGRVAAEAAFDPFADHALAHVFTARGDPQAALRWLLPRAEGWSRCSSFLYTHNWWHVALAHLALGDREAALALFDQRVWAVRKDHCQDQVNAVSLLARLDMAGASCSARWSDLADWLQPRTSDHVNGLLDLHTLLGLARAGRDEAVERMGASLAAKARHSRDTVWRDLVPTTGAALVAHARQQWATAAHLLGKVLPHLSRLGGSSVQRDLFARMHADAVLAPARYQRR